MTKPKIILASASIGRRLLLEKLGLKFRVITSTIDEDIIIHQNPFKMLQMRSTAKADDIVKQLAVNSSQLNKTKSSKFSTAHYQLHTANYLIVAADSMAILGNQTFGKAKNKTHANEIIKTLMGKTHVFATATCIIHSQVPHDNPSSPPLNLRGGKNILSPLRVRGGQGELESKELNRWEDVTKTRVTLRNLDPSSLDAYVSRYDFTRFAAGYSLDETPWDLVTKIDGSYTNVVGLPFEVILPIFHKFKIV